MYFNFEGYPDINGFSIDLKKDIDFSNYKVIRFSSAIAQKTVFEYYKIEMQQGDAINAHNLGFRYINQTGFFDLFPHKPSWSKFKNEFCSHIMYSFTKDNDVIYITPLNVKNNSNIYEIYDGCVLEL